MQVNLYSGRKTVIVVLMNFITSYQWFSCYYSVYSDNAMVKNMMKWAYCQLQLYFLWTKIEQSLNITDGVAEGC